MSTPSSPSPFASYLNTDNLSAREKTAAKIQSAIDAAPAKQRAELATLMAILALANNGDITLSLKTKAVSAGAELLRTEVAKSLMDTILSAIEDGIPIALIFAKCHGEIEKALHTNTILFAEVLRECSIHTFEKLTPEEKESYRQDYEETALELDKKISEMKRDQ